MRAIVDEVLVFDARDERSAAGQACRVGVGVADGNSENAIAEAGTRRCGSGTRWQGQRPGGGRGQCRMERCVAIIAAELRGCRAFPGWRAQEVVDIAKDSNQAVIVAAGGIAALVTRLVALVS